MSTTINGRYQLQQKIGQGGMGVVYRATDRLTGETVALKQIKLSNNLHINDSLASGASEDNLRLAIAHEFQILAGLRHPHIISVLDYGFDEERQPFFTMTYLPESQNILEAAQDTPLERKIELIQQLLQALAYLHRRGVLHRDLKPDNVLVTDGTVRVLDFGLSSSDKMTGGDSVGTPLYMAPELFEGETYGQAADLYAVGVMLYQMLTNEHPIAPFDHGFLDRVLNEAPDFEKVDAQIRPFLTRLLAKTAAERFATTTAAIHVLAEALDQPLTLENDSIRESYLQAATFVGREPEMAQLTDALARAKYGAGTVTLLGGESGVGKSRLLDEFRTYALVEGWQVLTGQEVAEGGVPYQIWREIVERMALTVELSDLEASVLYEVTPFLAQLLEREIQPAQPLSGSDSEQRLALTFISLLQRQTRPTLLILEDMHWSKVGLEPLKQMLKVLEQLPNVAVIGSYRDDERPQLPDELSGAERIELERLNNDEVAQLSGAMLGEKRTNANIIDLLAKETEGNTFFIVEVMRALAEDAGHLLDIGETELPTEVFTNGMDALLQRRLNKVAVEDSHLLQLAAVAGRQLDVTLLESLQPEVGISAWLQRISDASMLSIRDGQWFFSHDKLRQATLNQLLPEQLKVAHRQVASAIEQLYPDDERYYAALLNHWQAAEDNEKELRYLLPVAKQMIEVLSDSQQGPALASRGLTLLSPSDSRQIVLLNLLAGGWAQSAKFVEGEEAAREAYALAQACQDESGQATSLNILGIICREQSRYSQAQEYIQQALEIGQATDDTKVTATSLLELGVVAEFQKNYAVAENYFQQSLSLFQGIDDQMGITNCYFHLGMLAAQHQNNFEAGLDYSRRNLEVLQKIGNQRSISKTFTSMGIDNASLGRYATARDLFQQSLAIKESIGDLAGIGHTYLVLGECYYFEGIDYEKVLHHAEKSLEIYLQTNALAMVGIDYGYIALSHVALGNYEKALETALSHFKLQSTIELDKSNGLVHTAVAKILSACQAGQVELDRWKEKLDALTEFTQLAATPNAYIEEAIRVSTIAQIRMVVLIECGQHSMQIGDQESALCYLSEAKTMAQNVQNQHKLDQIETLLADFADLHC